MKNIYSFFVTIFILYLVLAEYELIKKHSDTILGRIVIIACLLFYTSVDKYLGLFFCLILILFLQDQLIENMLNLDDAKYLHHDVLYSSFSPNEKEEILKYVKTCPISSAELNSLYNQPSILNKKNKHNERFKRDNCDNLKLKYKNMDVPDEMSRHVFPELQFHSASCNICSNNCKFSVLQSKLETEKKLQPENTTFL